MKLFPHQVVGRDRLVASPSLLLGDEMRLGKTAQSIAAVEYLYRQGKLDRAIVVAPAQARAVWADEDTAIGQIAKFATVDTAVMEYKTGKPRSWEITTETSQRPRPLEWVVTNYEFVRLQPRLGPLLKMADKRTALILDESIAVANKKSAQWKACRELRVKCGWAWLLNGTPAGDSPEAIFGQFTLLDPEIIGTPYITHFRSRYAVMNPYIRGARGNLVKVDRWINLDDLARRTAPYVLRRTMDEVFDLPPALDPVVREVRLNPDSWKIYKDMRAEAIAYLGADKMVTAMQAGTKAIRLAQITSGFLTGAEDLEGNKIEEVQPIGREKIDDVRALVKERLAADPNWKGLIWTRFRYEAIQIEMALRDLLETRLLVGMQKKDVRDEALELLNPEKAPAGPCALVGTEATGKYAFNFAAAADVIYASNDWSLIIRDQSMARVLGSAQKRSVLYTDICAVGPKGEKTVDHIVVSALHSKRDLAHMTAAEWKAALEEQE